MKRFLTTLFAAAALLACGPDYDRTDITGIVTSGVGGSIDIGRVTVPEGTMLKAHIVSYDTDHKTMSTEVTSADGTVMQVTPVKSADDYAFLGLAPGRTTVEIKADGHTVLVIDALVTQQPAPP